MAGRDVIAKRETQSAKRLSDPTLDLRAGALPDETVRGLIDDWIVPALVERFLSGRDTVPESNDPEDNGQQL